VEIMLHLRLRRGRDDDLIEFFGGIPPRMRVAAVKMALRSGGMTTIRLGDLPDEEDLEEALDALLL